MGIHPMKKNFRFTQVSDPDGWEAINALYKANPTAGSLFVEMVQLMDSSNGLIASMSTLGARIGKTRQTVAKAVSYLEKNKFIQVFKSGNTNVYTLNASLVWKDSGYKRVEAQLYCSVLLSLDEQSKEVQRKERQLSIPMPSQK